MSVVMQGFTREEIREFMHQYYLQPHGTKKAWVQAQQVPVWRVPQWRKLVYAGDLDRNLIPRDHGSMTRTYGELSAFEKKRAQEIADHQAEVEQLKDRTRMLEGSNTALGKAIGLLHDLNVSEPETPQTRDPKHP